MENESGINDGTMVGLNARIPLSLNLKIEQVQEMNGLTTKTAALIWMLDEYLNNKEKNEAQVLNDLESIFKIHNSVMIPLQLYKEITGKTQDLIDLELEKHHLKKLEVGHSTYICLDNKKQQDLVLIEQLILKQDMIKMKRNMEKVTDRLRLLEEEK